MLLYRNQNGFVRSRIRRNIPMKSGLKWSECIKNWNFLALYFGKQSIDVDQVFARYDDSGFDFMRYGRNVITHMYEVWITISLM